jgi:hypothetical protein
MAQMPGWRRSADRTRLQMNSLQTGNFTGNFAIFGPRGGQRAKNCCTDKDFSHNSLSCVTGNLFQGTGEFLGVTGILARITVRRPGSSALLRVVGSGLSYDAIWSEAVRTARACNTDRRNDNLVSLRGASPSNHFRAD